MERLKEARAALDLTQRDVAKALKCTQAAVAAWERRAITPKAAMQMEQAFGVRAAWLLTGDGEMLTERAAVDERLAAQDKGARDLLRAFVDVLTVSQLKAVISYAEARLKDE